MQHKIYINGKRYKVIYSGNNYEVNTATPFDWASYGNLAGKTLSFNSNNTSDFYGFSDLIVWLFNSGVPVGSDPNAVVTINLSNGSTIVIKGNYDGSSTISLQIKDSNNTTKTEFIWIAHGGVLSRNIKVTLPIDVDLSIANMSFKAEGANTDYYLYKDNQELILGWLNEHLIVE
jgi:hypothetical protein